MSLCINGVCTERLHDIVAGLSPTFTGWDTDPTNAENITDGDETTTCDTGIRTTTGAYQMSYMTWALPAKSDVIVGLFGCTDVTAGTAILSMYFAIDGAYRRAGTNSSATYISSTTPCVGAAHAAMGCTSIRLGFTSSLAADVSPLVTSLNAWRVA